MATSPKTLLFTILSVSFLFLLSEVHCSSHHNHKHRGHDHHHRPTKLFFFGDSYADTGNLGYTQGRAWKKPYGMTFPGMPSGRFSDGRVLSDFVAKFLGMRTPIPYKSRSLSGKHVLSHGMNFAQGGAGLFDTIYGGANMSTQVAMFEDMIDANIFTGADLNSSVALVCFSGNDYSTYNAQHPNATTDDWQAFIQTVIGQLRYKMAEVVNSLGVPKLAVTALPPLGCLPAITVESSYRECDVTDNTLVEMHNYDLQDAVKWLNNQTTEPTFFIIDVYTAFFAVLNDKGEQQWSRHFDNPMIPCCVGKTPADNCGIVAANGEKNYTLCEDPVGSFFWDSVHPTDEGWRHVFQALKHDLEPLRSL